MLGPFELIVAGDQERSVFVERVLRSAVFFAGRGDQTLRGPSACLGLFVQAFFGGG
jgi:hypothetical protein